jgi:hypothetical protein
MNVSSLSVAQQRAIDRAKETLVEKAEELLRQTKVGPSGDFGHSQLRNLVAVATETESPAVVLNFIRYQMGRDKKERKGWARDSQGSRVGDLFITALGEEQGTAVGAALATIPDLAGRPLVKQLARMELIRYFLGFAGRYMKYLELETGEGAEEDAE